MWWKTYIRIPGRGLTFDDPDLHANIFILVPSIIYVIYNVQIYLDPTTFGANFLYVQGDILYFVGSLFYLAASLRDNGFFFFMPTAGGFRHVVYQDNAFAPHYWDAKVTGHEIEEAATARSVYTANDTTYLFVK